MIRFRDAFDGPDALRAVSALTVAGAILIASAALAGEADLPTGEELMEKLVAAKGGREALEKHTTSITKGAMIIDAIGLKADITSYAAKPDKSYVTIEIVDRGTIERGASGGVAWELSPLTGPRVMEGEERAFMLREAAFHGHLNWRQHYDKVECVGLETVHGHECYTIELTPPDTRPLTLSLNKETCLPARTEFTLATPAAGDISFDTVFENYTETDGVVSAGKITQKVGPQTVIITKHSVEYNVQIPEDRFDLPQQIQALLKENQAEKRGEAGSRSGG